MVGFLAGGSVETRCGELAKLVEDCLGSGIIADVDADVVGFE